MSLANEFAARIEDMDHVAGCGVSGIDYVRAKDPGVTRAETASAFRRDPYTGWQGLFQFNMVANVFTIGHSKRSAEELIAMLRAYGVKWLADVRTIPRSKRNPQFNREELSAGLKRSGIEYAHMPALGGLRHPQKDSINTAWRNDSFRGYADYMQTDEFETALENLIHIGRSEPTAIMCAEAVPWRCHRSLIADALTARGAGVQHIMSQQKTQPHLLTPFARAEGARVTYPGIL